MEKNKTCIWGFYLDLNIKSKIKYGSVIKYLLFEKLFEDKNIIQINCSVKKGYEWIRDWILGKQINFNYKLNCYNLVLKKEVWNNKKLKFMKKVSKKTKHRNFG